MKTSLTAIYHKCGHISHYPGRLLGRGKARQQRIHDRESSPCADCQQKQKAESIRNRAASLTRIDGVPYTAEEQAAYIAKHS